jgi:hypothetical protein
MFDRLPISHVETQHRDREGVGQRAVAVTLQVSRQPRVQTLTLALTEMQGVLEATSDEPSSSDY